MKSLITKLELAKPGDYVLTPEDRASMFIEWCALQGFPREGWPKDAYKHLLASFTSAAAPGWRSMETVPEDAGQDILVLESHGLVRVGNWDANVSKFRANIYPFAELEPANWMPLPELTEEALRARAD